MPIDKYADEIVKGMQKAGKAILVFTVERDPEDDNFAANPPSVDLYILPKDKYPEVPQQLPNECFRGTISGKQEQEFKETVESFNSIFKRIWKKKVKREPRAFWIVAEPAGAWKDRYERTVQERVLQAVPQKIPLIVSLKPKKQKDESAAKTNTKRGFTT